MYIAGIQEYVSAQEPSSAVQPSAVQLFVDISLTTDEASQAETFCILRLVTYITIRYINNVITTAIIFIQC